MNVIKLSVCIATRNRATTIGESLESIIRQATDEVEIVIVDGASSDNTEQVVNTYKDIFTRLHYFKENHNGGVDRDYCKAVDYARGQYCWFMSDDDIFKEGAVAKVLENISFGYDLIVVNTESRNTDLSRVLLEQNTVMKSDRVYPSGAFRDFFINTAKHLSYIPAVVIKRALWNARVKAKYFGSNFVHVGVIFQMPLDGGAVVLERPMIAVRRGNVSWSSKSFEVWLLRWPRLIWSLPLLDDAAKESVTREEPWKRLTVLIKFRGSRCYSSSDFASWIGPSDCGLPFKLLARMISFFPVSLLSPIVALYLMMFQSDSKAAVYEIVRRPLLRKLFNLE